MTGSEPLLLFLHIPKSGGTTLGTLLANAVGSFAGPPPEGIRRFCQGGVYYHPIGFYKDPPGFMPEYVADFLGSESVRLAVGHFSFGLHRLLEVPCRYLTMLRHPVDRVLSLHAHLHTTGVISPTTDVQRFVEGLGEDDWQVELKSWHPEPPLHPESLMRRNSARIVDNDQARRLAGDEPEFGQCSDALLEAAKANLETFGFVGLTERFDESVLLLTDLLGWADPPLYLPRLVNSQRIHESVTPEVRDAIEARNQLDLALYEHAASLFNEQLATRPAGHHRRLSDYRDRLRRHRDEHVTVLGEIGLRSC